MAVTRRRGELRSSMAKAAAAASAEGLDAVAAGAAAYEGVEGLLQRVPALDGFALGAGEDAPAAAEDALVPVRAAGSVAAWR